MIKTILVINMGENILTSCQPEQSFSCGCESQAYKCNISILKHPECSLKQSVLKIHSVRGPLQECSPVIPFPYIVSDSMETSKDCSLDLLLSTVLKLVTPSRGKKSHHFTWVWHRNFVWNVLDYFLFVYVFCVL